VSGTVAAAWRSYGAAVVRRGIKGGDQRTVFRGVDWHTYNRLSEATVEGRHVRLIYDGKDLEILVTGNVHEHYKELLITIVNAVTMGLTSTT
jgi:hypothetical protein